jgi:ribosomal protein S12 methylthiotransferase accessory factor YcaO
MKNGVHLILKHPYKVKRDLFIIYSMMSLSEKWMLKPTPKYGCFGVPRIVPSSETRKRIKPILKEIEVKSARDIIRVDTDGIPVFVCKRTCDNGHDSYSKGKGYTGVDSKVSALMEAVERYSAEKYIGEVIFCTYEEIQRRGFAVNPADLYTRVEQAYTLEKKVEWVQGFDLIRLCPTFVPLNLVVFPYVTGPEYFRNGTSGLASGNTMEEALSHALCEVIEHDSIGISSVYNPGSIKLIITNPDIPANDAETEIVFEDTTPNLAFPLIDVRTFPKRAARVAQKLQRAGLLFFPRNMTTDIGVASINCDVVEKKPDGTFSVFNGAGTHPDAKIALLRALCEAAQCHSSALWLHARNLLDMKKPIEDPWKIEGYGSTCSFSDIPSVELDNIDEDIRFILSRLEAARLDQAIAVDLTKPELGIPSVRVLIPKTEYLYEEPEKKGMGPRGKILLENRKIQFAGLYRSIQQQNRCKRG